MTKAGEVKFNDEKIDRYIKFKNRLKRLLVTGTDNEIEGLARREQSLLREWLFGDEPRSTCAICGEVFNVSALVTAHKKNRSICSDAERVDPHIVFPLCVFGCDYLYEVGAIEVSGGVVVLRMDNQTETADYSRAQRLSGGTIDEIWLKGDIDYFD